MVMCFVFFFSSRRRHTRCALVTGVQTCALPISTIRSATSSCKWQQNNGIKGVSPMQLRRISFTVAATLFLLAAQAPAMAADSGKKMLRPEVGKPLQAAQTALQAKNYAEEIGRAHV